MEARRVSRSQRSTRTVGFFALLGLLLLLGSGVAGREAERPAASANGARPAAPQARFGRVVRDFAPVHDGPGREHPFLWRLYEGSQVAVAGDEARVADGTRWRRIRLWNTHDGWIEAEAISFEPYPPPPPPPPPVPAGAYVGPCGPRPATRPSPAPQPLSAPAMAVRPTALSATLDGEGTSPPLAAGAGVLVDAWGIGGDGRVRYHVRGAGVAGWAAPGAVTLRAADPPTRQVDGRPIIEPLRGTGLWFTLDSREHGEAAGRAWRARRRPPD